MKHPLQFTDPAAVHAFIFGGRARFTLVSSGTGKRYTYRVAAAKDSDTMFFVSLLTGSSNETDYESQLVSGATPPTLPSRGWLGCCAISRAATRSSCQTPSSSGTRAGAPSAPVR
jgi:hypothetical protein